MSPQVSRPTNLSSWHSSNRNTLQVHRIDIENPKISQIITVARNGIVYCAAEGDLLVYCWSTHEEPDRMTIRCLYDSAETERVVAIKFGSEDTRGFRVRIEARSFP